MADNSGLFGGNSAAGSQSQTNQIIQLMAQIVQALQSNAGGQTSIVQIWSAAGNLDIATAYSSLKTGTILIKQTVAAALNVTLTAAGPWVVGDGAGVAAADNITVLPPAGYTINGGASDVISTNWQCRTYTLDNGTNFVVTASS